MVARSRPGGRAEGVVDHVVPVAGRVAAGDVGGGAGEVDVGAVGGGAGDLPVDDEQGDVVGDVGVPGADGDGQAEGEELGVGALEFGPRGGGAGGGDEDRAGLVDPGEQFRAAGVEGGGEDGRVLCRVGARGRVVG